jgi:NTP pyrophosphatase (non-canonical NTP hydrolase)
MNANEYQQQALITKNRNITLPPLLISALGLAGEAGEVADEVKKWYGHDKPQDRAKLIKELGDVLWYCASVCDDMGLLLGDVMTANIDKLKLRYPDGFSTTASVAKADEKVPFDLETMYPCTENVG